MLYRTHMSEISQFSPNIIRRKGLRITGVLLGTLAVFGGTDACMEPTPSHAVTECSKIINKASFTYTKYDWVRKLWDGQSQQRTIVDYKLATADGKVVTLPTMEEYIDAKIGTNHCETKYVHENVTTSPTPTVTRPHTKAVNPGEKCDKVTAAEILTKGGIAVSNLLGDGELRSKLDVYPTLTTQSLGTIIVDEDTYVLHPVGTTACFKPAELANQ